MRIPWEANLGLYFRGDTPGTVVPSRRDALRQTARDRVVGGLHLHTRQRAEIEEQDRRDHGPQETRIVAYGRAGMPFA